MSGVDYSADGKITRGSRGQAPRVSAVSVGGQRVFCGEAVDAAVIAGRIAAGIRRDIEDSPHSETLRVSSAPPSAVPVSSYMPSAAPPPAPMKTRQRPGFWQSWLRDLLDQKLRRQDWQRAFRTEGDRLERLGRRARG